MDETATVEEAAKRATGRTLGEKRDRDRSRASWAATLVVMGAFSLPWLYLLVIAGMGIPVGFDHVGVQFGFLGLLLTPPLYWWWRRSGFRLGRRFGVGLSAAAGFATWYCTPKPLPWGMDLAVAMFAFTATVPFVGAFLLAPEPRDPDATNVFAERKALRTYARSWTGSPAAVRAKKPVATPARELRDQRTAGAVSLAGIACAFAVVPNLLVAQSFFVVTREAQVLVPDYGPAWTWDDRARTILDLVASDPLWAVSAALLVAAPLFFWWWRRSRWSAGWIAGAALSAAAGVAVLVALHATPLVPNDGPMWGFESIVPGTERSPTWTSTSWTLVVAAALFAAAFVVAPPPRKPDVPR